MNAVGLLFKPGATQATKLDKPPHQMNKEEISCFQSMLNGKSSIEIQDSNGELLEVKQEDLIRLTMIHILGREEVKTRESENEVVIEDKTIKRLLSLINSNWYTAENEMNDIENFISAEEIERLMSQLIEEHNNLNHNLINPWITTQESTIQMMDLTDEQLHKQFADLYQRAKKLLANVPNENTIMRVAPKVLELLKDWVSLEQKTGKQSSTLFSKDETNVREQRSWQQLINTFQKRNRLVSKHQYNHTAEVTSADVAKWITKLLGEVKEGEPVRHHPPSNTTIPMSRLEQYMIHVNQAQESAPKGQQIIERIKTIMTQSSFLARSNGINQLSIALKPENLGDMTIRLAQINGEMTVKIIVTSATTRKMLESNIHQLKNMFSPQQVIIEKQDVDLLKTQEESEEQSLDDSKQEEQHQENKEDTKDDKEEFELQFQQFLNEKV